MKNTKQLARCALLISLALVLSYTERLIPLQMVIPLPGIKLGLANIVTLIALYLLGAKSAWIILVLRCLLANMFGGGITSLLFSLTGGLMAMAAMRMAMHCSFLSIYGVSILGAAAHNIGQILASMLLMHSVYIAAYLPYLLMVALATGTATGCCASGILRSLTAGGTKKNLFIT